VQHRRAGQRDVHHTADPAVDADDDVLDVVGQLSPRVAQGVHLAGVRVDLGVGGEPVGEGAAEVAGGDAVEFVVQFDRERPSLDQCERAARVPADAGVGPERDRTRR
jgi:hypothetical protein